MIIPHGIAIATFNFVNGSEGAHRVTGRPIHTTVASPSPHTSVVGAVFNDGRRNEIAVRSISIVVSHWQMIGFIGGNGDGMINHVFDESNGGIIAERHGVRSTPVRSVTAGMSKVSEWGGAGWVKAQR